VAYYPPRTMGNISHGCHGPLSEAAIVECIVYLHGSYTDSIAELEKQQKANVELRRRPTSAAERAERASAHAATARYGAERGRVPNRSVEGHWERAVRGSLLRL
jgi:hypothetical protein